MVFSSIPIYLDPPNWQQQANQQQPAGGSNDQTSHHLPPPPPPPQAAPPQQQQLAGSGLHTPHVRPNSMVERARLAKVPLPEAALKCPRCESTNTKFCYFNNYSLSQPRHFCKTCRRYWTRGGALRNVPVGGGCRRNKRSKSNGGNNSRSKSTVVVSGQNPGSSSNNTFSSSLSYTNTHKIVNMGQISGLTSNLPILPPLQGLGDYNSNDIALDFGGIQISNATSNTSGGGLVDQWRSSLQQVQQFPFLINTMGLEQSSTGLYPLVEVNEGSLDEDQAAASSANQLRLKPLMETADSARLKAEGNEEGMNNLSRNFLGNININSASGQYTWGVNGNSWSTSHLPGFTSNNSTNHLL